MSSIEEEELRSISSELESSRQEEFRFISKLSHISRSNLNGIVNYLFFLEQDESSSEKNETDKSHFGLLNQCCDTILTKLDSIVNYVQAKIKRSNPVIIKRVNIRNFINDLFNIAKSSTTDTKTKKKVSYRTTYSEKVPEEVELDQGVFSGIFVNLATNALKYCQEGLIEISVDVVDVNNMEQLFVQVKDTGIGIAKEKIESLFVPLNTISDHESLEVKPESFSLGLTIVKSLVERMNGSLDITSEGVGKGSTAKFTIPFRSCSKKSSSASSTDTKISPVSIPTVFVVDDNVINRRVMKVQLERICKSAKIIECVDGMDCLTRYEMERLKFHEELKNNYENSNNEEEKKTFRPLIFTDLNMPNMSGKELSIYFRNDVDGGDSLVIAAISASVMNKKRLIHNFGFDFVVAKPLSFDDMNTLFLNSISLQTKRKRKRRIVNVKESSVRKICGVGCSCLFNENENFDSFETYDDNHFTKMMAKKKKVMDNGYIELLKIGLSMQISVLVGDFLVFLFVHESQYAKCWEVVIAACLYTLIDNFLLFVGMVLLGLSSNVAKTVRFFTLFGVFANGLLLSPIRNVRFFSMIQVVNIVQQMELLSNIYVGYVGWLMWVCSSLLWEFIHYRFDFSQNYVGEQYSYMVFSEYASIAIFVIILFDHSSQYITFSKDRKHKLQQLVVSLKTLAFTHQLTISKISHDLIPPASALLFFTEEMMKHRRKNSKSKDNKLSEMENDLLFSVQELNFAMKNFIICCKIRYNKVRTRNDQVFKIRHVSEYIRGLVRVMSNRSITVRETFELGKIGMDDTLFIDTKKVLLVVGNLVSNASLHSGTSVIDVNYIISDLKLGIEVRDYGKGIENLDAILDGCDRLDHFMLHNISNSGLGFGIKVSKYLACRTLEGGDLIIENCTAGGGAKCSFECSFVLGEKVEQKVEEEEEEVEGEEEEIVGEEKASKVLVLDDQIINRLYAERHLKEFGFEEDNIVMTGTVDECLEVLQRESDFELFMCDFHLSGSETAVDVMEAIRNSDNIRRPRNVVLCTGRNDLKMGDSTCQDYFDAVLEKPFSFDDVVRIFDKLLIHVNT